MEIRRGVLNGQPEVMQHNYNVKVVDTAAGDEKVIDQAAYDETIEHP